MTTYTANVTSPTDATSLRVWGRAIQDAFLNVGLVQTTDTGQVTDWNVVTYPTVVSTPWVYQVFRFADPLQATKPIFIRVEYRFHTTNTNWYLAVFIGTGTDGAGNITGLVQAYNLQYNIAGNSARYTDTRPIYSFSDGSSFWLAYGYHPTAVTNNGAGWFWIERYRDSGGGALPDGYMCGFSGSGGLRDASAANINTVFVNTDTATQIAIGQMSYPGIWLPGSPSASVATEVALMPGVAFRSGKYYAPPLIGVTYRDGDLATQTTVVLPVSGLNRTYMTLGTFTQYAGLPREAAIAAALRWE